MRTPPNERLTPDIADPLGAGDRQPGGRPARHRRGTRSPARHEDRHETSERRCVLTGETHRRHDMVRLALSPSGLILPDVQAKAPGRGAWIGVDRDSLTAAIAENRLKPALSRAFKSSEISWPDDLPAAIEHALTRLFLDRLGLEMRCGNVVLGSAKIEKAARDGKVAALFHAADASVDGMSKLDQAWRVGSGQEGSGARGVTLPLDRAALSVALGRENVVHLALADRRAADRIAKILARLTGYTGVQNDGTVASSNRAND